MSDLIVPSRRRFLAGALGLIASPAIIRVADLMSIKAVSPEMVIFRHRCGLLTIREITMEVMRLWKNSNQFIINLEDDFAKVGPLGTNLRIRLPNDF